ncbi:MAG TPA: hypothetical protein ACFCUD_11700 [Cyclobacteriaceae bacterium]
MIFKLLKRFENLCYGGFYNKAYDFFIELLNQIANESSDITHNLTALTASRDLEFCTRLAACIEHLFITENAVLDQKRYLHLLSNAQIISHVFYLSAFRSTSFFIDILRNRSIRYENGKISIINVQEAHKFLLSCHILNDASVKDLISLAKSNPQGLYHIMLRVWYTWISADPQAVENKRLLSSYFHILQDVNPSSSSMSLIHHIWSMSSYDTHEKKHDIKKNLQRCFYQWNTKKGLKSKVGTGRNKLKDKPTLMVICEVMWKGHVMYRCFGAYLHDLRSRFYVIALTDKNELGPEPWDWCDHLITLDSKSEPLSSIADQILSFNPDILCYPSLGMRLWATLLGHIRLAPIQVIFLGHPSSSFSPVIDFVMVGSAMKVDPKKFSEKVIELTSPGSIFDMNHESNISIPVHKPAKPTTIRIAICANIIKLSSEFAELCIRLSEEVKQSLEFYLFQNLTGMNYLVGRKQFMEQIHNSKVRVFPRQEKKKYYELLKQCHIYLSPFPFGGENSTLDALLMHLPVVTLLGDEPHGQLDYRVLKSLQISESVTYTKKEYYNVARALIEKEKFRDKHVSYLKGLDFNQIFYNEYHAYRSEICDKLYEVYRYHNKSDTSTLTDP